jgi:hypothetical protein
MIASNRVNFKVYIRPISILMDLLIISILGFIYLNIKYLALVIILLFDNRLVCCCHIN